MMPLILSQIICGVSQSGKDVVHTMLSIMLQSQAVGSEEQQVIL